MEYFSPLCLYTVGALFLRWCSKECYLLETRLAEYFIQDKKESEGQYVETKNSRHHLIQDPYML